MNIHGVQSGQISLGPAVTPWDPDISHDQTAVLGQLHDHATVVTWPENPGVFIPLGVQPAQNEVFRPNAPALLKCWPSYHFWMMGIPGERGKAVVGLFRWSTLLCKSVVCSNSNCTQQCYYDVVNVCMLCYIYRRFLSIYTSMGYRQTLITWKLFKIAVYIQRQMCRHNYYLYNDIEKKFHGCNFCYSLFEIVTPTPGGPTCPCPSEGSLGHLAKFRPDRSINEAMHKTQQTNRPFDLYIRVTFWLIYLTHFITCI